MSQKNLSTIQKLETLNKVTNSEAKNPPFEGGFFAT